MYGSWGSRAVESNQATAPGFCEDQYYMHLLLCVSFPPPEASLKSVYVYVLCAPEPLRMSVNTIAIWNRLASWDIAFSSYCCLFLRINCGSTPPPPPGSPHI